MEQKEIVRMLESITGKTLKGMPWQEVVEEGVLGLIKDSKEWVVPEKYMKFLAEYPYEVNLYDRKVAVELFTIALQRIWHGAVPKTRQLFDIHLIDIHLNLSDEHKKLALYYYLSQPMTKGCYDFIMGQAMVTCLNAEATKALALEICFALLEWINPDGSVNKNVSMLGDFADEAASLFLRAEALVRVHASFEQIYYRYARKGQWEKHKMWFSENFKRIDWNAFFRDTHVLDGCNFIERAVRKKKIKEEIKTISLKKAM